MVKNIFYFLVFYSSGHFCFAQNKTPLTENFICTDIQSTPLISTGIESEQFLAINDTTWLSIPNGKEYIISKKILQNEVISDFSHVYNTTDGTYFVHSGGGVVLFYNGKTITRVDDSFYHQNQYGGKSFVYNNEIYLFGGQGLFTQKNILTRYDKNLREWLLVPQNGKTPDFNAFSIGALVDDSFYYITAQKQSSESYILPLLIYKLDLVNMNWTLLGQTSNELANNLKLNFKKVLEDPITNTLIIKTNSSNFLLDLKNNTAQTLELEYPLNRAKIFPFNQNDSFVAFYCDNKLQMESLVLSRNYLYEKIGPKQEFYTQNLELYYTIIAQVFALIIILLILVVLLREIKLDNRIVIRLRNGSFIYKLKRLRIFEQNEVEFFMFLAKNNEISFSQLEELISLPKDGAVTRTKNRERFIRLLKSKLKTVFNLDPSIDDDLLIIKADPNDKRSKIYYLNMEYFKFM